MDQQIWIKNAMSGTTVDQDRWHSAAWRDAMDRRQQIPIENRALINPQLEGQNCGSTLVEMQKHIGYIRGLWNSCLIVVHSSPSDVVLLVGSLW